MNNVYCRRTWLGGILFGLCLAFTSIVVVRAAVTLVSFEAEGVDGKVLLTWETASELDNAGFFIQRSNSETGTYQRVSFFIPSMGDDVVGAQYYFEDDAVTNGVTYWYKLEALDYSQNADFYGPISAVPGIVRTATNTPTITQTPTRTSTAQPGATTTAIPTNTLAIPTATATQSGAYPIPPTTQPPTATTPTVEQPTLAPGSPTALPTETLIPLPSITFVLPSSAGNTTGTLDSSSGSESQASFLDWFTPQRVTVIGLLLMIWTMLAIWFAYTVRQVV